MANGQAAARYNVQPTNTDSEREKVIERIRKLEQQEQKENGKEENATRPKSGKISFDFIDLMDYSAQRKSVPERSVNGVEEDSLSDAAVMEKAEELPQEQAEESAQPAQMAMESIQLSQPAEDSIQLTQMEAEDNHQELLPLSQEGIIDEVSLSLVEPESIESSEVTERLTGVQAEEPAELLISKPKEEPDTASGIELEEESVAVSAMEPEDEPVERLNEKPIEEEAFQPTEPEERKKSVYDTDKIFAPMLKRTENISLAEFLADDTDEEMAYEVEGELYINTAASIRLLVKAGHASLHMKHDEAGKLWGAVCFYSIDAGYTNMAFWNIANVVYKSDSAKSKAILKVIIKKEKKLMQIIDQCLSRNQTEEE